MVEVDSKIYTQQIQYSKTDCILFKWKIIPKNWGLKLWVSPSRSILKNGLMLFHFFFRKRSSRKRGKTPPIFIFFHSNASMFLNFFCFCLYLGWIFQPANGCFAPCSLSKILFYTFLQVFPIFSLKERGKIRQNRIKNIKDTKYCLRPSTGHQLNAVLAPRTVYTLFHKYYHSSLCKRLVWH